MTPTPHDALFKATFSHPEHAAGVLRAVLPPALVARIDFSSLVLQPGSFIDEALAGSHTDLLYSVLLSQRRALIYLLFEHRSKPHAFMPFRLLKYMVRIWDCHLEQNPQAKTLPAIVPVVLHHGPKGWTAAVAFEDLIDLDDETRAALAEHMPRFRFLVDDLGLQDDAALRERAMTALGRLVLLCFKHAHDPDELLKRLARWADVLRDVWRAPNGAAALQLVVHYIFEIGGQQPVDELLRLAVSKLGKDAEEVIVSYAEQLRREGRREGLQRALVTLVRARFGELPEVVTARVNAAKIEQLDLWLERVLTASTLEQVFGDV